MSCSRVPTLVPVKGRRRSRRNCSHSITRAAGFSSRSLCAFSAKLGGDQIKSTWHQSVQDSPARKQLLTILMMIKSMLLSLLPVLLTLKFASGQAPKFTTPPFTNTTHRTSVCGRFLLYAEGNVEIRNLLQGLELSVGIVDQGNDIYLRLNRDKDNSIFEDDPGIFVNILDELADRAGFTWRNSYALVSPPNTTQVNPMTGSNYSWTDVLLDAVKRYDFSFAEWVHNQDRRKLGISFPVGWFDASTILVQNRVDRVAEFEITAFLKPFSNEVWYLICAVIFFSGIVYWIIDRIEYPDDKINSVVYDTFLTTLTFTQHHMYWDPSTHGKRIFAYSAAFWALVLASAYTANLASFLVAQKTAVILAQDLDEVQRRQLPLCVRDGAAVFNQINSRYVNENQGVNLRASSTFQGVYEDLNSGKCDMMATRAADFDAFKNDRKKNPQCSLEWVGRAQFVNKGGPGTLVDTSVFCTSVISHVLDVHMHEMITEGFIDKVWNQHLRSLENYSVCAPNSLDETQTLDGEYALQMTDVGGAFVFHAVLIMVSIIVTLIESPWRRKRHAKKEAALNASPNGGDDVSLSSGSHSRPSMERRASSKSLRNLAGAELANFYQVYQESSYFFTPEEHIRESIRNRESIQVSPDGLMASIEKMTAEIDRLHRHVVATNRRNENRKNDGNDEFCGKKDGSDTSDLDETSLSKDVDGVVAPNPNEGK
eukprot:scaffold2261_cov124-Cylindrotheca_fusiformis.AAC.8